MIGVHRMAFHAKVVFQNYTTDQLIDFADESVQEWLGRTLRPDVSGQIAVTDAIPGW